MYHQHKCWNPDHDCGSYYQVEWVYMVNRIGPSTDPCGTPYFSVTGSDVLDPIWTICILSWRYDLNHLKVSPLIPNEWFNRSKSFWWSMVSKLHSDLKVLIWLQPQNPQRGWYHFVLEGGPFRCYGVVCMQTEKSHRGHFLKWLTTWTHTVRSVSLEIKEKLETDR